MERRLTFCVSSVCVLLLFAVNRDLCAQDAGKAIRTWTGSLGRSQFGVFSKDSSRLVYAIGNNALVVDVESGTEVCRLAGHSSSVSLARFSGDGKKIISVGQDETIRVWNSETGKQLAQVSANTADPSTVLLVSQTGNRAVFSTGKDQMLRLMDLDKKTELSRVGLTAENVFWRAVTPDGRVAMSNGIENGSKIWDIASGQAVMIDNGHHNYCGQFSHDGTKAIMAGEFNWEIWDPRRKVKLKAGTVTGGHIYSIATSTKTDRLLTGLSDGAIWVWDTNSGKEIFVFRGHDQAIGAIMISPDRKFAVSEDSTHKIILWRLP